jgi:hypothetical protein
VFRKKLAAARRGMTRRARVARRKRRGHKGLTVEQRRRKERTWKIVARGTSKGRTSRKRCRAQPECNSGIRNRDLKERLLLGSRRTLNKTFRQTAGLEIVKRTIGSSVRIRKTSIKTLWSSRPLPKRKKRVQTAQETEMQERQPLAKVLPAPTGKKMAVRLQAIRGE